ncbi:MAG: GNAT family N-acetyltransferase [Thermoguttaceae bacterium]
MIQIRGCIKEDFQGVLKLLEQLWPEKPLDSDALREVFLRALGSDSQLYVCAIDGEKLVGFGSLSVKHNLWQQGLLAHLDELIVDELYRGRGIGARLLEHIISQARRKGCARIDLNSAFHREDAHKFYKRNGFENRGHVFTKVI